LLTETKNETSRGDTIEIERTPDDDGTLKQKLCLYLESLLSAVDLGVDI
jgi:hypothetical protein